MNEICIHLEHLTVHCQSLYLHSRLDIPSFGSLQSPQLIVTQCIQIWWHRRRYHNKWRHHGKRWNELLCWRYHNSWRWRWQKICEWIWTDYINGWIKLRNCLQSSRSPNWIPCGIFWFGGIPWMGLASGAAGFAWFAFGSFWTLAVAGRVVVRKMLSRHVGHVCWRWNHDRKQAVWNMCPHGNFFELCTMSSLQAIDRKNLVLWKWEQRLSYRQMMQMLSDWDSSSAVASGYKVFILLIARRESITSFSAFLKFLWKWKAKNVSSIKFHSVNSKPVVYLIV